MHDVLIGCVQLGDALHGAHRHAGVDDRAQHLALAVVAEVVAADRSYARVPEGARAVHVGQPDRLLDHHAILALAFGRHLVGQLESAHRAGDRHVDAPEGVDDFFEPIEVDAGVEVHGQAEVVEQGLIEQGQAATGIVDPLAGLERHVDALHAVERDHDVQVARDRDQRDVAGAAPDRREDQRVGAVAHLVAAPVGADQQHVDDVVGQVEPGHGGRHGGQLVGHSIDDEGAERWGDGRARRGCGGLGPLGGDGRGGRRRHRRVSRRRDDERRGRVWRRCRHEIGVADRGTGGRQRGADGHQRRHANDQAPERASWPDEGRHRAGLSRFLGCSGRRSWPAPRPAGRPRSTGAEWAAAHGTSCRGPARW